MSRPVQMLAVVALAGLLVGAGILIERAIVTDAERIELFIQSGVDAVLANDIPRVQQMIHPSNAQLRADVARALAQYQVREAKITDIEVEVRDYTAPRSAIVDVTVRVTAMGHARRRTAEFENQFVRLEIDLSQQPDSSWIIENYRPLRLLEKRR